MFSPTKTLDPRGADPFEVFHGVHRDKARWQWLAVGLLTGNIVLTAALTLSALRPPQIIVKDRLMGDPPVVTTMGPAPTITELDARVFFLNMLKLRFSWDSLTVERDMQAYLGQCFKDQRQLETHHLQEPIEVDAHTSAGPRAPAAKKLPRLQAWIGAGIKNTLLLPQSLDDIACQRQEGVWHCCLQSSIVTQRLWPPLDEVTAPKARMAFVATLLEVRHTVGTPSGLIVGALRQVPVPAAKQAPL